MHSLTLRPHAKIQILLKFHTVPGMGISVCCLPPAKGTQLVHPKPTITLWRETCAVRHCFTRNPPPHHKSWKSKGEGAHTLLLGESGRKAARAGFTTPFNAAHPCGPLYSTSRAGGQPAMLTNRVLEAGSPKCIVAASVSLPSSYRSSKSKSSTRSFTSRLWKSTR